MKTLKRLLILIPYVFIIPVFFAIRSDRNSLISLVMAVYLLSFVTFIIKYLIRIVAQKKLPEAVFQARVNVSFFGIGFGKASQKVLKGVGLVIANLAAIFMLLAIPALFFITISFFLKNLSDPSCHYVTVENTSKLMCDNSEIHFATDWNNLVDIIKIIPLRIWGIAALWHIAEVGILVGIRKGWKSEYWGVTIGELIQNVFGYLFGYFIAAGFQSFDIFFLAFWGTKLTITIVYILGELSEGPLKLPPSMPE